MAKTINFCGDSFCYHIESPSWPYLLARSLKCKIVGRGKGGSAYEHAIQSFDNTTDYTVFCWTEPHRLHHPKYPLSNTCASENKNVNKVYASAHAYLQNVHDYAYGERRQTRELYWFDHEVLSQYQGVILHCWSFKQTYQFKNGINFETPLNTLVKQSEEQLNHLTHETNFKLFTQLYKLLRSN